MNPSKTVTYGFMRREGATNFLRLCNDAYLRAFERDSFTSGDWEVNVLVHTDEEAQRVDAFAQAAVQNPLHTYQVAR